MDFSLRTTASMLILVGAIWATVPGSAALAQAPSDKPQNPLEVKPPAKGEEKAYKAWQHFQSIPDSEVEKKTAAGEEFLSKFANSSYATYVYQYLAVAYIRSGQVDKGIATGEKDIEVNPSDFRTMAVLGQTLSRTVTDATPDAASKLAKAESYAKNAIAGVANWVRPDSMSEETFNNLRNDTLAMAHASLGLVAIRRNNFDTAIPELEQAVQLGSNSDPTSYYLLGLAQQNSGHPDKAVRNFEKCAAVKGTNLTSTCTVLMEQSQKDAQSKPKP